MGKVEDLQNSEPKGTGALAMVDVAADAAGAIPGIGPLIGAGLKVASGVAGMVMKKKHEDKIAKMQNFKEAVESTKGQQQKQYGYEDPTQTYNFKQGTRNMYRLGTRNMEVEKGEVVTDRNGKPIYDFTKNSTNFPYKSHTQGGIPAPVIPGGAVISGIGKKGEEYMEAYKSGDNAKMNTIRMSMPNNPGTIKAEGDRNLGGGYPTTPEEIAKFKEWAVAQGANPDTAPEDLWSQYNKGYLESQGITPDDPRYAEMAALPEANISGGDAPSMGLDTTQLPVNNPLAGMKSQGPSIESKGLAGGGMPDMNVGSVGSPTSGEGPSINPKGFSMSAMPGLQGMSTMPSQANAAQEGGGNTSTTGSDIASQLLQDTPLEEESTLSKVAGNVTAAIPGIYNTIQGLRKPAKTTRYNYNPQMQDFRKRTTNEPDKTFATTSQNLRRATGGSSGTYIANLRAAGKDRDDSMLRFNQAEANRGDAIRARNIESRNQAQGVNIAMNQQADVYDLQNEAARSKMLGAGLSQLSQVGQLARKNANQARVDRNMNAQMNKQNKINMSSVLATHPEFMNYNFNNVYNKK